MSQKLLLVGVIPSLKAVQLLLNKLHLVYLMISQVTDEPLFLVMLLRHSARSSIAQEEHLANYLIGYKASPAERDSRGCTCVKLTFLSSQYLVFVFVDRMFHPGWSHGCCPVRATGDSLPWEYYLLAPLAGNYEASIGFMPTTARFPNNNLNTLDGGKLSAINFDIHSSFCWFSPCSKSRWQAIQLGNLPNSAFWESVRREMTSFGKLTGNNLFLDSRKRSSRVTTWSAWMKNADSSWLEE